AGTSTDEADHDTKASALKRLGIVGVSGTRARGLAGGRGSCTTGESGSGRAVVREGEQEHPGQDDPGGSMASSSSDGGVEEMEPAPATTDHPDTDAIFGVLPAIVGETKRLTRKRRSLSPDGLSWAAPECHRLVHRHGR
ncbi:unnamed protein product, partial [Ectocarpus fasciculatus]